MNKRMFACLVLTVAFFAGQAYAQVAFNTGSIYGKVLDANGGALPGVTVTVESSGMAPKLATTGPGGSYRFTGLVPGSYSLTFSLQGFTEVRQEDVRIAAGQTVDLEVTLKQTTEEVVVVTGVEPVVDTKQTGVASAYSQDYLTNVPNARDPWVILDQTPGIDVDRINVGGSQSGQQSIFTSKGGSSASNAWSYDGVDISDPAAQGATPAYYDFDSFQEIQITTGGQDPAISTGGVVINFITKRGGNTWSGQASGYFDNDGLQSNNVDAELLAQHFLTANEIDQVYEYGGDVGGPIIKDKAWVWGAYRDQRIKTVTAGVLLHDQVSPILDNTVAGQALQDIELESVNAKFNIAYNQANEGSFQYLYNLKTFGGRFNFPPNQQSAETTWDQDGPTKMYKAEHTWIPNANLFLDAKYAYVDGSFTLDPKSGDGQGVFRLGPGGVTDFFLEKGFVFYHTFRPQHNVATDVNYFKQNWLGGDHEFKFGFAYKQSTVTTSCQYGGDVLAYDYSDAGRGAQSLGQGYAHLRYLTNAIYDLESWGVYAGDTWRMNRLTLNLGVRFDHHTSAALASDAPANRIAPDLLPALHFPGNDNVPSFDNISPRVGATYDVSGDGKTIVRGNYARFYDGLGPTPANFINVLGEDGLYTGLYIGYKDINGDGVLTRDELDPSFFYDYFVPLNGLVPGDAAATVAQFPDHRFIDPDLKAQSTDEFLAGFERQLMEDVSVSATYTYRKYDNLIDSYIPGITSENFVCTPLVTTSPITGETFTTSVCDVTDDIVARDQYFMTNAEGRTRTYNGVEVALNKRMADKWMLRISGEFKDQKIHYDGPNSFQDPTNIAFTDNTWWAEQSTGSGSGGVFTGARWSFKASGAYQFPYDITAGAYLKVIDGNVVPIIRRRFTSYQQGFFSVILAPFDELRLDTVTYVDLRIEKGFAMGNYGRLSVSADIFNLFNANTALRLERRANNVQFKEPQEIVSPRIVRFGLRYLF